jgi:PTH1 family peptidyl-tRNA hydrolase
MAGPEQSFILAGLGNPGPQYLHNRHNVGFMFIDRVALRLDARGMRLQSKALVTTAAYEGRKILLAKPQTYMNLSGQAVHGLAHFYKLPMAHLLLAHDDLDLAFGTLRLRPGGGAGGQKGVASAIERLGSQDFARLRIGIGRPPGRMDPADYVLQNFAEAQLEVLSAILDRAASAALEFITNGLQAAMTKFNGEFMEP